MRMVVNIARRKLITLDDVELSDTVESIKTKIEMHEDGGISRHEQRLILPHAGREMEDDKPLSHYKTIEKETYLFVLRGQNIIQRPKSGCPYTIYCDTTTGEKITLEVESSDVTIAQIKSMIEKDEKGIPRELQRLTCGQDHLEDEKTLADYEIWPGLHILLHGGRQIDYNKIRKEKQMEKEKKEIEKKRRKRKRKKLLNIGVFLRSRLVVKPPPKPKLPAPKPPKISRHNMPHEQFWQIYNDYCNKQREWLKNFDHVERQGKPRLHLLRTLEINYISKLGFLSYYITLRASTSKSKKRYRARVAVCFNGCKFLEAFGIPRSKRYKENICELEAEDLEEENMSDEQFEAHMESLYNKKLEAESPYKMTYYEQDGCEHIPK